jgi:HK97 family phage prohead protease
MDKTAKNLVTRFEVKELDDNERTFSGLAAAWSLDLGGDVIEPGAFKRTLKSWKKSKRVLPLLDSHNGHSSVRNVVGKMLEAEETADGLLAGFKVIEGPDGDEVFRRVKGGYVDGLSIGYQAVEVRYPETEEELASGVYRYLKEVKLQEVSVVLWPMNQDARIDTTTAKALLMAAKDKDLTEDDRAELKRLAIEINALLGTPIEDGPTPEPAPEVLNALSDRIQRLTLHRLATRIEAVRHAGSLVVGNPTQPEK